MRYEYKVSAGSSGIIHIGFLAEDMESKPYGYTAGGDSSVVSSIGAMVAQSESVHHFEEMMSSHSGYSIMEDDSDSKPSSSMSWGSNSSDDEDE
tara:strand:- start:4054 stop:4335 length:282 start_codon:yes stop_codon:yes gene_type:complete